MVSLAITTFELSCLLVSSCANPVVATAVVNKVNSEYDSGSHIVITTARPIELELFTKQELESAGVKYHQIIFGIARGTRYIINDRDPKAPEIDRAIGINLNRNEGLCM
jgi:hypothetical protein